MPYYYSNVVLKVLLSYYIEAIPFIDSLNNLEVIFTGHVTAENVGWTDFLDDNPTEFHDLLLSWEKGFNTPVPDWITGVYVRNGPAQVNLKFVRSKLYYNFEYMFF